VKHVGGSPERNVHFGIAAGCGRVHRCRNSFHVQSDNRPLRSAQHHQSYAVARELLPIAHVLVGGKKHVEPGPLCCGQQVAVGQRIPSPLSGVCNGVARKETGDAARRYMVKKNELPLGCVQRRSGA